MTHRIDTKILVTAALLMGGGLTACDTPDPLGRLDDFEETTEEQRRRPDAGEQTGGQQVDFSGQYLLALETPLGPNAPLLILVDVNVDENFVADFDFQPLSVDNVAGFDANATPREPVGELIEVDDVQIGADGSFIADLGQIEVGGNANPLTGRNIVATIALQGVVLGPQSFCGTATGDVLEPLTAPLTGSTFGTVPVPEGNEDLNVLMITAECPEGALPTDDAGTGDAGDAGDGDAGDAGMPDDRIIRCPEGLEGRYTMAFLADVQSARSEVTLEITASDDPTTCYTGDVIARSDGSDMGDINSVRAIENVLTWDITDFVIPPGASPVLPNGGTASLELEGPYWLPEASCGTIFFSIDGLPITSGGSYLMVKEGQTEFSIAEGESASGCPAVVRATACGTEAYAQTYELNFKTDAQGAPTVISLPLEGHPLVCLTGTAESLTTEDLTIAKVQYGTLDASGNLVVQLRNFLIPPGASVVLPNGGVADVFLTSTELAADFFCGDIVFTLFDPFPLESTGTFAAGTEGNEPTGITCADR